MNPIKTILIDDEINGRENLRSILLEFCSDIHIVSEADSALTGINEIEKYSPDLIFLDIEMPGGNGFEVLKYFPNPDFKVIFVTAYDHFAIQAIRFSALDYILKPIDVLKLKDAVRRFIEQRDEQDRRLEVFLKNSQNPSEDKRIALPFTDKIDFVEIKHIIKCQGEGGYTRVFTSERIETLTSKPLVEYEELLEGFGFIRTHKAHIVNTRHILSFVKSDGGYLLMSDQSMVPVSRRKKEQVLEILRSL